MSFRFVAVFLTGTALIAAPRIAVGQHHDGGQVHEHAAVGTDRAGELQQALRKADKTVTKATDALEAFKARYKATGAGPSSPDLLPPLGALLAQMHALHAFLENQAVSPATLSDAAAVKAFRQACDSLAQIAAGFDALLRHLTALEHRS